jgi:uncharacterized integral membrane protein (TIGR00698 family)
MLMQAVIASCVLAAVATPLGSLLPLIGAPIIALAIGMAIATIAPAGPLRSGLAFTSRYVLQTAIVLLGATLDLPQVARVGAQSLPVMLGSLLAALLGALLFGALLRVPDRLKALLGVGTGICGASAIAAVSGVLDSDERDVSYAISTIFVFNLIAVLLFIPLGHLLGMSQHQFGLWDGTAVNDVSSVVAAGYAFGHAAGAYAVIVKLARTSMIVPISLGLAALRVRREQGGSVRLRRIVPWFLIWFLAASAADTLGLWEPALRTVFSHAGLALTTVALAAVGLSSDLRQLRHTGGRPLALGALVWLAVSVTSLGLQQVVGQ